MSQFKFDAPRYFTPSRPLPLEGVGWVGGAILR
jgi:hypothetical protein